tara:strand:+ start:470 stop:973 length:504 start_codon:yes stop_codon:yes gene_type:complete
MSKDEDNTEEKKVIALNIDGIEVENARFVSKVTGMGWSQNAHKKWAKVINQVGTVIKDEIHQGKNHTTVTLKAGTQVIIDDIRGRINPQYRVLDRSGKIWFVSTTNIELSIDELLNKDESEVQDIYIYRGGIRVDNTEEVNDVIPKRYKMPLTTEGEIELKKGNKDG